MENCFLEMNSSGGFFKSVTEDDRNANIHLFTYTPPQDTFSRIDVSIKLSKIGTGVLSFKKAT